MDIPSTDSINGIANQFFGRGNGSESTAAHEAATSILNESGNILPAGQTGGEFMAAMLIGIVMSGLGFYFVKKARADGLIVYFVSGLVMAILPFFVYDPYILSAVFLMGLLSVKFLEF